MSATRRILPGFGASLGLTVLVVSLATLLPLGALVVKAAQLSWADIWFHLTDPRAVATYRITLGAAALATVANLVLGVLLAWVLVRYEFPGRRLIDAAVDLPFALPTAVAGISLAALTVPTGWVGRWFEPFGWQIAYAFPGVILAMAFTSFPFVVRTVQPVLEDLDAHLEEAAHSLGAGPFTTFRRVIFPELRAALVAGGSLAFVRSLGEFGAVVFIAGNLPFETEITALLIYIRVGEYDYPAASVLASAVLLFALVLLVLMNVLQAWLLRHLRA